MMAKDEQGSQLNLTVVALVALVAIVGLVALVLNTSSLAKISTGGALASAQGFEDGGTYLEDGTPIDENLAGQLRCRFNRMTCIRGPPDAGCGYYTCS